MLNAAILKRALASRGNGSNALKSRHPDVSLAQREASPIGALCRNHAEEYPELCAWSDPVDEAEEDSSFGDDRLYNDQTGYDARRSVRAKARRRVAIGGCGGWGSLLVCFGCEGGGWKRRLKGLMESDAFDIKAGEESGQDESLSWLRGGIGVAEGRRSQPHSV